MTSPIEKAKSILLDHEVNVRRKDIKAILLNIAEDAEFHILSEEQHIFDKKMYGKFCEDLFSKASLDLDYQITSTKEVSGLVFLEGLIHRELFKNSGDTELSNYYFLIIVRDENDKAKIWQMRSFLKGEKIYNSPD